MTSCAFCKYSRINKDRQIECHRRAPAMLSGTGTGWSNQLFPVVEHDEWCGEFEWVNGTEFNKRTGHKEGDLENG